MLSQPQGHSVAGRIMSTKNSNDTIGNRIRDLPACSAVPQPTVPPRAPMNLSYPIRLKTVVFSDVMSCGSVWSFLLKVLSRMTQQKREEPRSSPSSALHQPTRRQVPADNLHSRPSHILKAHTIYILIYSRCRRLFSQRQLNVVHENERRCRCHDRHNVRSERSLKRRDRQRHGDPRTGFCTRRKQTRPSVDWKSITTKITTTTFENGDVTSFSLRSENINVKTLTKCCVLTYPPYINLIFHIVIARKGDETLKDKRRECNNLKKKINLIFLCSYRAYVLINVCLIT